MSIKNKIYLLITTANINNSSVFKNEIEETIVSLKRYEKRFESIFFIETIRNETYEIVKNYNYFFSNLGNHHQYKGTNWMNHMSNFIKKNFEDTDILVFLAGRYQMISDKIFELIQDYMIDKKIDFIAKNDGDIYNGDMGVHTFYLAFRKKEFMEFSNYYFNLQEKSSCVEIDLKKYMEKKENCLILPKDLIMGVKTNTYESKIKKIC
jgi:hypothetical protein